MIKRAFDIVAAAAGLVVLSPLIVGAAAAIKYDSSGTVLFRQRRIGRHFVPFTIYKFRTMAEDSGSGPQVTCGEDPRITRVGRLLRWSKIDELPQLFNVLRGDMSVVGPRPEVPQYVSRFHADYAEILKVRPGITDLASLKFRDEAALLAGAPDPLAHYVDCVLPEKIDLAKEYIRRSSFGFDLLLIAKTLCALVARRPTI